MYSSDFVTNLQGIIQSPFDRELPIMRVAQDLYNFISSFSNESYYLLFIRLIGIEIQILSFHQIL